MGRLAIDPAAPEIGQEATPSVLLSHPTGNQNVRNALRSLTENRMLAEFWTTIAWNPGPPWNQALPSGLRMQLARRAFEEAPRERVKCVPWREMVRLGVRCYVAKGPLTSRGREAVLHHRHLSAPRPQGGTARKRPLYPNAVYAYEGGALADLPRGQTLGHYNAVRIAE